tara:strand:+ start:363 stop:572 length:210 start_codon:yes stop_codon:yes gene_type:complete
MAKKMYSKAPYLLNFILVALTAYCLIKYTMTMEQNPTCSAVVPEQRKFLYWAGIFTLANIIVAFSLRIL